MTEKIAAIRLELLEANGKVVKLTDELAENQDCLSKSEKTLEVTKNMIPKMQQMME